MFLSRSKYLNLLSRVEALEKDFYKFATLFVGGIEKIQNPRTRAALEETERSLIAMLATPENKNG